MPPSPGSVLRALLTRWRSYKYRFVPWVALNLARNRRTLRYVSPGCSDKVTADAEVCSTLITFLRALFTSDITRQRDLLSLLPPSTCAMYPAPDGSHHQQCPHATHHADEVMYKCLGFSIDRHPSSLDEAGTGVFVSKGSCSGRDQLGPLKMCDCTWLTSTPRNPLSVGQYINNCSNGNVHVSRTNCIQNICKKQCNKYMSGYFIHITRLLPAERAANVCYQEFDVPESFPVELRQYIPNVRYSHDVEGPLRCVVLVALRDIHCGEELFSNYFTLVQ
ncbi:SET domain-containing protein 9 isoform X3 [Hyla sarda]|uniref:SET domain-containing protein 9 isoform X3 n=1 Tax=Hyla sarda TaxID=327740 RepID=UPI0024C40B68|nr:SET domain-containing protein 9 isoform X3 [Hyla sarda]